jgi:hypothetical protein
MNIYAFYQSIPTADQPEEFACANWWKTSWTANGWTPIMLNRSHAQGSPLYNKLQQKLAQELNKNHGLVARAAWFQSRFTRWCALHAAGGGWMSDYDVLNLDLTPRVAKDAENKTLLLNEGPAYLFYASAEHCLGAIRKFISEDLSENGIVRPEIDILNCNPEFGVLLERVVHVRSRGDKCRSAKMQEIFSQPEEG